MTYSKYPKRSLLMFLTYLFLVAAALGTGSIFYAAYLEAPYLSYPNKPFETVGNTFAPGDVVPFRVLRCNSDNIEHSFPTVRALVNIETGATSPVTNNFIYAAPGCNNVINTANSVPPDTPDGTYKFIGGANISGTLRTFEVRWSTAEFKVRKKETS